MTTATIAPRERHAVEQEALWDLENLAQARRLGDWMFEQFRGRVGGRVAEVGAGIGTYTERLLACRSLEELLLIEPEPACLDVLEERFGGDPRVRIAGEALPHPPSLLDEAATFDFIVALNVVEHVEDHYAAVATMVGSLAQGGSLTLLVPAHPFLYGPLDRRYGHSRRYTRELLRDVVERAGLEVEDMYSFNLLGVPGWWISNRRGSPSISSRAIAVYERIQPAWAAIERRFRVPLGLSLIVHGRRPGVAGG